MRAHACRRVAGGSLFLIAAQVCFYMQARTGDARAHTQARTHARAHKYIRTSGNMRCAHMPTYKRLGVLALS